MNLAQRGPAATKEASSIGWRAWKLRDMRENAPFGLVASGRR